MNHDLTIRYNPPTKYDVLPYGTIIKVLGDGDSYDLFVQCSSNLEYIDWKPARVVLLDAFKPYLDEKFLSHCLALSSGKPEDKAEHLKEILNSFLNC